jgi:uncharacterized protein (DUF1501 family)
MTPNPSFRTRREFLRTTVLGGALSWTVPAFLSNTFSALHAEAADSATQIVDGRDGSILVVLQMAGGNDGINTVIPYASDHYRNARPKLGIVANDVLKLNDAVGFHPSMTGFKSLYDAGNLTVVQGVGYPNPNRSHFRSTEIWQTATDSDKFDKYGWIGRYFDNACAGCDPTVGISIGNQMPQAFSAKTPEGIALQNPQNYRFLAAGGQGGAASEQSFRKMNDVEADPNMDATADTVSMDPGSGAGVGSGGTPGGGADLNSGGTIASISGPSGHSGSALDFLERTSMDAQVSSDKILAISNKVKNQGTYPGSQLANSLKLVARLIGGGLPTRIYYVSQGGYDTHTNQLGTQQRLLQDLGDSLKAFTADLRAQGSMSRVLVMTFSEFGRRVTENASGGTDHGAAAPLFVIGDKVKAGLQGTYPSLAPGDLFEGDIKYSTDFRSVYAGVLEGWLKTPSKPILGRQFQPLLCT